MTLLPPRTHTYPAAALTSLAKPLGSTSFFVKRVGGERRHENGGWDEDSVHSAPGPECRFRGISDNSETNNVREKLDLAPHVRARKSFIICETGNSCECVDAE